MSWLIYKPWLTGSGYTPDTGADEGPILEMLREAGDDNFEIIGLSKLKGSLMKPPQYPDRFERPRPPFGFLWFPRFFIRSPLFILDLQSNYRQVKIWVSYHSRYKSVQQHRLL